jgi:glycogen synthase kinase 3 beta
MELHPIAKPILQTDINFDPKPVGSGAFGKVYKGVISKTNQEVAVKKVYQDQRYKNRELQIMLELNHINIVHLVGYYYTKGRTENDVYLNCVMEYVPITLSDLIAHNYKEGKTFPINVIKVFAYQMLKSVGYLQSLGICHRDIKPQNIMINPKDFTLKLCDFGCAKKLVPGEANIAYICSRYYRPPELCLESTEYNCQVDMWSMGCVIAELVLGKPIFRGKTPIDQIAEIIKVIGVPTKEEIKVMNPKGKLKVKMAEIERVEWRTFFGKKINDEEFYDLIDKIFVYDPNKRLKPYEAMCHPFFKELKDEKFELPGGVKVPKHLFMFQECECKCSPEWVSKLKGS